MPERNAASTVAERKGPSIEIRRHSWPLNSDDKVKWNRKWGESKFDLKQAIDINTLWLSFEPAGDTSVFRSFKYVYCKYKRKIKCKRSCVNKWRKHGAMFAHMKCTSTTCKGSGGARWSSWLWRVHRPERYYTLQATICVLYWLYLQMNYMCSMASVESDENQFHISVMIHMIPYQQDGLVMHAYIVVCALNLND